MNRILKMLYEDRSDFIDNIAYTFSSIKDLNAIANHLYMAVSSIHDIYSSPLYYIPIANQDVYMISNTLSIDTLNKESTTLFNILPKNFSILSKVNPILLKYISHTIVSPIPYIRTKSTVTTIIANMMTILDAIAHMSSRKGSHTICARMVVKSVATRVLSNPQYAYEIDNFINSLSNDELNLLLNDPQDDTYIYKYQFQNNMGYFTMDNNGLAILDDISCISIAKVHFMNNTNAIQFDFGNRCVYWMYNGGWFLSYKGDNEYYT